MLRRVLGNLSLVALAFGLVLFGVAIAKTVAHFDLAPGGGSSREEAAYEQRKDDDIWFDTGVGLLLGALVTGVASRFAKPAART